MRSTCDAPQGNNARAAPAKRKRAKQKRRMCAHPGCKPNIAQGATGMCIRHGGGKRCAQEGCIHGAAGATDYCIVHGGGIRCPNCATWPDSRGGKPKYDGHCATCFKRIFPSDPRSKVIYEHTKEIRVRNELTEHFDGFVAMATTRRCGQAGATARTVGAWTTGGSSMGRCCAWRRTSTLAQAHARYDEHDEEIRYDDLYMAYSGKWIFIRFNPDGRGVDMEDKLARLIEEVETQIGRIERSENTEPVEIIKLFY